MALVHTKRQAMRQEHLVLKDVPGVLVLTDGSLQPFMAEATLYFVRSGACFRVVARGTSSRSPCDLGQRELVSFVITGSVKSNHAPSRRERQYNESMLAVQERSTLDSRCVADVRPYLVSPASSTAFSRTDLASASTITLYLTEMLFREPDGNIIA